MEIRNLLTFTKVAEAESLSQAARLLGYAQSTVTMQMQQLEQELGVPLYERVGKKIRITQAGQELLTYAIPIIRMSQEAIQIGKTATPKVEGSLRLGIVDLVADDRLADRLNLYMNRYPMVQVEIVKKSDRAELYDMLRHNRLDLLLTLEQLQLDGDFIHGEEDQADFLRYFVTADHPLTRRGQEIEKEDYPILGNGENTYETITLADPDLALRLVAAEKSGSRKKVAVAPESMAENYVKSKTLVALEQKVPGGETYRQTLYHKNKWVTEAMSAWMKMTEDKR